MRCLSCNKILDEAEESLTYEWDEPIELCLECLEDADLSFMNNTQYKSPWSEEE